MVKIPTLIPESFVSTLGDLFSGGVLDILWKLFVGFLLVVLILALSQLGILGALIGSALFGVLFQDDVRAFVVDVWRRDFWVWKV